MNNNGPNSVPAEVPNSEAIQFPKPSDILSLAYAELYHNFSNHAAGRTCRLLVFKEVHLTSSFLLQFILELIHGYCVYIVHRNIGPIGPSGRLALA